MIPLKDDTPRLTAPLLNYFLIGANVVAFLFELSLGKRAQHQFLQSFALVPAHLLSALHLAPAHVHHGHAHAVPLLVGLFPIFTSMFLHAGWWHLIFNMWFLWVFGRNLEDGLGHLPYLIFYLTCGVAAAVAQTIATPFSLIPTVGASGAIAGVMGGYFVLYPRARVLMLVPFFFIFFLWLPAWVVLGYWFVLQFLSGVGSSLLGPEIGGGIAFWAHVGGFLAGVLLVRLFPRRTRRYYYGD
jgi:membrane associated rhomboid family serine protease